MTTKILNVINFNLIARVAIVITLVAGTIAAIYLYNIAVSHKEIPTQIIGVSDDSRIRFKYDGDHYYIVRSDSEFLIRSNAQPLQPTQ